MLPTRVLRQYPVFENSFRNLRDEFDRLWEGFGLNGGEPFAMYPVDIREDNDHMYIDAEMPGFKKDQIEVTLENGVLTICGERKPREQAQGESQHLSERRYHRVCRRFTVPNTVDEGNVDAQLEDGVLHLTLHKREEVKPRKIEVK